MAEYKHGSMDIHQQVDTFAGFVKVVKWTVIFIVAVLLFLAVFAT